MASSFIPMRPTASDILRIYRRAGSRELATIVVSAERMRKPVYARVALLELKCRGDEWVIDVIQAELDAIK